MSQASGIHSVLVDVDAPNFAQWGAFIILVHPFASEEPIQPILSEGEALRRLGRALPPNHGGGNRIQLGDEDDNEIKRAIRQFYEIGKEYNNGAASLREVSRRITDRSVKGKLAEGVVESCGHLSRAVALLERYFSMIYGFGDLFVRRRYGMAFERLSEDGAKAWRMAQEYLLEQKLIDEND